MSFSTFNRQSSIYSLSSALSRVCCTSTYFSSFSIGLDAMMIFYSTMMMVFSVDTYDCTCVRTYLQGTHMYVGTYVLLTVRTPLVIVRYNSFYIHSLFIMMDDS